MPVAFVEPSAFISMMDVSIEPSIIVLATLVNSIVPFAVEVGLNRFRETVGGFGRHQGRRNGVDPVNLSRR